ncbi:hypothetical protein OGAPHI_001079 [Ogataea philodendri]|uniref:Uncharacterized protein n=1 Tax=Ogataea philodendri TaxID=1378263 RepID=A0A9P8T9G4_9ASCO|nr:uncharacterized protein OGAPHI_001079 [Ogataea philodendri]KAH3670564.1 hypothetical protein OGAPHI_001079 [Ogataea philodendri]
MTSNKSKHSKASAMPKNIPFLAVPRIYENRLSESVNARTLVLDQLNELGPPDLVHFSKYDSSSKSEVGEYHYCIGINTVSMVQPYMYLQTVQLADKRPATEKHPVTGIYCSYNCFSKGDLRIQRVFPDTGVPLAEFLPTRTMKKYEIPDGSSNVWLETYVSSIVRSLLFSDDIERQLPGMCKFNLFETKKDASEAIVALVSLIPKGVMCGCSSTINQPTIMNNNLVDALLRLLEITGLYELAFREVETLEKSHKGLNANVLKVKMLLQQGETVRAVKLMHSSIHEHPRDGLMLMEQARYLNGQNRADLALPSAQRAVECLPTEFECWKTLIESHILNKDFHNGLLALNSCPMYTDKKADVFKALKPKDFEFPFPLDGKLEGVWQDAETLGCISGYGGIVEFSPVQHVEGVSSIHLNIYEQITKLHSTFRQAYSLLAIMERALGWSELLKLRSSIFVMENEYNNTLLLEQQEQQRQWEQISQDDQSMLQLPVETRRSRSRSIRSRNGSISSNPRVSKFRGKRLSERWLDSLFLILYDNLKSVLIWENEKMNNEDAPVQHIALEWELIAMECFSIHRFETSLVPYKTCLDNRFSVFAGYQLLRYYLNYTKHPTEFSKLHGIKTTKYKLTEEYVLKLCCKLMSWNHRYYGDFSVECLEVLKIMLETQDPVLIKDQVQGLFEYDPDPHGLISLLDRNLRWLEQFQTI